MHVAKMTASAPTGSANVGARSPVWAMVQPLRGADVCGGTTQVRVVASHVHPLAHSLLALQLVRQRPNAGSHTYGAQSNSTAVASGQVAPGAVQRTSNRPVVAEVHRCGSHCVPGPAPSQPPLPLQVPKQPCTGPHSARRSTPSGSSMHLPGDSASAHEWHGWSHADSQQTPSTQNPDEQSLDLPHRWNDTVTDGGALASVGNGPRSTAASVGSWMPASRHAASQIGAHVPS